MEECYICLQEETNSNLFLSKQICKCKSLRIHQNCFKELNNIYTCSVCKEDYENIYLKDGKDVFIIKKGKFVEKYKVNSGGHKNGYYKCYYPDGTIFIDCFFIDGLRQGKFTMFYPNGILKETCLYIYGKKEGEYKSYYVDGSLFERICYRRDKMHGNYEIFDRKGNHFVKATSYKGLIHKKLEIYYEKNQKYLEAEYKKGIFHGRVRVWYIDGCLEFDGIFENGEYIRNYDQNIHNKGFKIFFKNLCYKSFLKVMKFCSRKKKIFSSISLV